MKKQFATFFLIGMLAITSLYAASLSGMYQAVLPAKTQADDERAQLVRQGLTQVLVKISADEKIATNAQIKAELRQADNYVQEFQYVTPKAGPVAAKYLIKIRYNKQSVTALLKKAGYQTKTVVEPAQTLIVQVANITKSNEIDDLITSLKQLESVRQVTLTEISGDEVALDVQVKGSLQEFLLAIAQEERLVLTSQDETENTLSYDWKAD